jgi:hypothetical protein
VAPWEARALLGVSDAAAALDRPREAHAVFGVGDAVRARGPGYPTSWFHAVVVGVVGDPGGDPAKHRCGHEALREKEKRAGPSGLESFSYGFFTFNEFTPKTKRVLLPHMWPFCCCPVC